VIQKLFVTLFRQKKILSKMAAFNYRTIQKIVTDLSKNSIPIYAHTQREKEALFEKIKTLLEADKRLTTKFSRYRGNEDTDWKTSLVIFFKAYDTNYSSIPYLKFDKLGRLCFDKDYEDIYRPVDFSTLQKVINEVFTLLEMNEADKLKKQKMRDLKTQGILAKLTEIAKEDGFEFDYEQIPTRIKLTIKLPEKKLLHIDILFANFQEVMQQVRPFIKNCREIAATGIGFSIEKEKRR
jgi:hypothetical protein